MGLREYVQEELKLKDENMIRSPVKATRRQRFYLNGAPGLYGIVEFSPDDVSLAP
jgi:hypothetical protein